MKHILRTFLILAVLSFAPRIFAQDQHKQQVTETSSSIPLVSEFHETIYLLWHTGFPEKKYDLIKEQLPAVQKFGKELAAVELPGILRDRKAKWETAVANYLKASAEFESACGGEDTQKLLDATESLHMQYEGLVRTIRPLSKEIDAYHSILYVVYHKYLEEMNIGDIHKASVDMATACAALAKADTPRRIAKKAEEFKNAVASLCAATDKLVDISKGNDADAVRKAVEEVHTGYKAVESIFD